MQFVRDESGKFVNKAIKLTKDSAGVFMDVMQLYTDLLHALLNLAIKIGLVCFLYPFIAKFVHIFFETLKAVGGPIQ